MCLAATKCAPGSRKPIKYLLESREWMLKMLNKFDTFVQFCFNHGGTLKYHKKFGEMGVELHEIIRKFEEFHPRAFKLTQKQKPFIVIACDEPYYAEAYNMIREHEIKKGTWSEEDERIFRMYIE
jgi:hypothetical protein